MNTSLTQSETDHQSIPEINMTSYNISTITSKVFESYGKKDFQSKIEARRKFKKKVCERSKKADRALLSPFMEKVVYFV